MRCARVSPDPLIIARCLRISIALSLAIASTASYALFDDDEARRQILQLRTQVNESQRVIDNRLNDLEAQNRNRGFDLINQIEAIKSDFAQLRGQIEILQNTVETTQKRQRDLYVDLDDRLRKLETLSTAQANKVAAAPPPVANGAAAITTSSVDLSQEQQSYDLSLEQFRNGRFAEAIATFQAFSRNYPKSALIPSAQYWIGNSQYAMRDYRAAVITQRLLITHYPNHSKAPDALLNIASALAELNDLQAARASLQEVLNKYPNSEAATKARQRLGPR